MPEPLDTRLSRLRQRAERALASGRRGGDVLGVLETMTREAPDGSPNALFAHRHLAEMQLEVSPWRAALHLRRVVDAGAGDDTVHALMGLCHALLGNYRSAVAEYRKAVKLAPRNPWYHHNLGHLLDVGLGEAQAALEHLRIAHRLQSAEHEITASLAHCLARLGQLQPAREMAELAVSGAPRNREHRSLLEWVQQGAPSSETPPQRGGKRTERVAAGVAANKTPAHAGAERCAAIAPARGGAESTGEPAPRTQGGANRGSRRPRTSAQVPRLLQARMPEAGFSSTHIARALGLWAAFSVGRSVRSNKPAVYAAAVEYAVVKLDRSVHVTQVEIGRRYGVAPRSIALRCDEICSALSLSPEDSKQAR